MARRELGRSLVPAPESLDDYDAIESVTFVGYPNGLYDTANYLPVTRRGTTATPLHLHWCGKAQFLVDASVFPGSSGSPVFALSEGTHRTRGAVVLGSRLAFLGVRSAVQVQWDTSAELLTKGPTIRTQQLLDLGVVQRWTAVLETVEECLRQHGL